MKNSAQKKTPPYIFACLAFVMLFSSNVSFAQNTIDLKLSYNMGSVELTNDAKSNLDKLHQALTLLPKAIVEVAAHTDSRASYEYNMELSQNRASAVKAYLVNKGIAAKRIVSIGYGESKPLNSCSDGVTCSEIDHQRNRRTEIRVIKGANNVELAKALLICEYSQFVAKTNKTSTDYLAFDKADKGILPAIHILSVRKGEEVQRIKLNFENVSGKTATIKMVRAKDYSVQVLDFNENAIAKREHSIITIELDPSIADADFGVMHSEIIIDVEVDGKKQRNVIILVQEDTNTSWATVQK